MLVQIGSGSSNHHEPHNKTACHKDTIKNPVDNRMGNLGEYFCMAVSSVVTAKGNHDFPKAGIQNTQDHYAQQTGFPKTEEVLQQILSAVQPRSYNDTDIRKCNFP